jgi:hypothetical protein
MLERRVAQMEYVEHVGGPMLGGFGDEILPMLVIVDMEQIKNAEDSRRLLHEVLVVGKEDLEFDFLVLTEGIEQHLRDADSVLKFGCHPYLTLHHISAKSGFDATANEVCRMFGCKQQTSEPLKLRNPDLSHLEVNKSLRRLQKEKNRRKWAAARM